MDSLLSDPIIAKKSVPKVFLASIYILISSLFLWVTLTDQSRFKSARHFQTDFEIFSKRENFTGYIDGLVLDVTVNLTERCS